MEAIILDRKNISLIRGVKMKKLVGVQGTQESVPKLEINVDTVYIRSNIE
jgi:hypothetical protein